MIAQQKGILTIQLLEVEWHDTPYLLFGCSLCVNWWGQSPDENTIILIPNGLCPPIITAEVPLVSNMKQVSRYFKDMGKLDLCLVVGKKETSEEEPEISLGNFSLDVANLSEDVQIQGSHAVFDKSGVFVATVALKLSISYFSNGADKKRIDWDKSSVQVPKVLSSYENTADAETTLPHVSSGEQSFDDLVTQRLEFLKGNDIRETEVPTFPSAVMKAEDVGRSLTAEVRPGSSETLAKGYNSFRQRKQIVMDLTLSPRDLPSTDSEISPRKQMVMDVEVRNPTDFSSKGMEKLSPRKHLILDVEVPSANRGHMQAAKQFDQFSERKQLVIESDVPTRERGHLLFPFDASSPRIALIEGELPSDDGSSPTVPATQHRFLTEESDSKIPALQHKPLSASGTPKGTHAKASRNIKSKGLNRSAPSRAKQRELKVKTPAKSRPLSAPAGAKVSKHSSEPRSTVTTRSKRKQLNSNDGRTLSSARSAALPRFVGLPQRKEQRESKTVSVSRAKTPLSYGKLPNGRHEVKYSSPSPQKHRPVASSKHRRSPQEKNRAVISVVPKDEKKSLLDVAPNSIRKQMVMDVELPSGNRGHTAFPPELISSPRLLKRQIREPLEEKKTGRFADTASQESDSYSSQNGSIAPFRQQTEPAQQRRVQYPHSSPRDQNLVAPGQTPVILTAAEDNESKVNEMAMPPLNVEASPQPKTEKMSARTKPPDQECGIHLESGEPTIAAQQLKSGWHELAGNLASLGGDEPCSPNMGESKNEETFYAESLSRLIARLEAFQQTLQKSSVSPFGPSAVDPDGNQPSDLSERLKDVDEHIKNISQHLVQILPEANTHDDGPKNPQVVTLRHGKVPEEAVADVEHLEELSFPAVKCGDIKPNYLGDVRLLRPTQTAPMDIFLRSAASRRTNDESEGRKDLNSTTGSRGQLQPDDCCEVHGNPLYEGDKSHDLNIGLILTVGKLALDELVLSKLGLAQNSVSLGGNAFARSTVEACSCSLTLSVPGLSTHRGAEQSLSISPLSLGWKEAYFGHRSQLNWSGLRRDTLRLWMSQAVKVSATLKWESGNSLHCEGSIGLGRVVDSMPKCYQTELDLHVVPTMDLNSQYIREPRTLDSPAAKLEIGITLLTEDMSGKPKMGTWMYLSVNSITACIPQLKNRGGIGRLYLLVRPNEKDQHDIPFVIDYDDKAEGIQIWRLCKGRHADVVFQAPKQAATLFIEIWREWRGQDIRKSTSQSLIGFVKVPLKGRKARSAAEVDEKGSHGPGKKNHGWAYETGFKVADENFSIWNSLKGVVCGSVGLTVVRGSADQMLQLQLEDRAARIIQSHARCFTERIRAGKEECLLFAGKHNRFAEQQFPDDYEGGVTRHVLEVTVLHVADLPMTEEFEEADSARCEGAFVKYLFPCDGEPFYTQDMRWSRTIFFSASVHHGIVLPASENLETHLMKMKAFSKNDGNLLFEVWGCFADDLPKRTYLPNKLRLSNSGQPTSWDMKREKYVKGERKSAAGKQTERLLGTCSLLQKNLVHMISEKRKSFYSSPEVRKKFYLPVQMDLSHFQTYKRSPTLVVQIAYFILEIEDRKAHMVDTIFSGTRLHEDSLLETTLEIDILRATGLQTAVRVVEETSRDHLRPFENGLNSYVRYSLFPSNRQLELIYPPGVTSIKANDFAPDYRWTGEVKVILNVHVLKELRTGKICFEVWHHSYSDARTKFRPLVPSEESTSRDICIGAASIPSTVLLHDKNGITGWHDLSRKGVTVGAIKLSVCFRTWRVRPL